MEQVCRACMTSSVALLDIFADQREPSLADMLNECVACEIKLEDELPKKICLACICDVQTAFKFKRKCEISHQVLSAKLFKTETTFYCDLILPAKLQIREEDVDLSCVKMEQAELSTEENQKEYDPIEESSAHLPSECTTSWDSRTSDDLTPPAASESNSKQTENIGNIQSEVLETEYWELPEDNIDLGCVKIENENEYNESTTINTCESQNISDKELPPPVETEPVSRKNQFQCPHCPKDFSQSSHLNAHIRTHTGERPYKCPHCPRAFSQASNLRKHLCIHSGERPFKCPHCPKAFTRHTDLQYHVSTHPGKQIHKCPHCTRYFIESAELEVHLRYHTGERTYNCTDCSKEFTYAWQLQRHFRTHTGDHAFKCPHCLKKCADKGALGRHIRSHTGERPHKCPHCPKAFTRAAYLKTHINTHSTKNN